MILIYYTTDFRFLLDLSPFTHLLERVSVTFIIICNDGIDKINIVCIMFTQVTALLLQLGTRRSLDGEGFVASWRRERSYRVGPILASPCPVRTTGSKQKLPTITWHGAFLFYVTSGTRTFLCYKVKMK